MDEGQKELRLDLAAHLFRRLRCIPETPVIFPQVIIYVKLPRAMLQNTKKIHSRRC